MILTEVAWAAGFFDGEGHAFGGGRSTVVGLSISQIERSTLDRFQAAVGVGRVGGPYAKNRPGWSPSWTYTVTNHADVQYAIALLWRFLSQPKRDQAAAALVASRTEHLRRRAAGAGATGRIPAEICGKGHPWNEENTRVNADGTRACRACHRDRQRAYYADDPEKHRDRQRRSRTAA